jgi:hypothetical protein
VWAGRDNRRAPMRGTIRWRIGVVLPGQTKPVFINQTFYGGMERV